MIISVGLLGVQDCELESFIPFGASQVTKCADHLAADCERESMQGEGFLDRCQAPLKRLAQTFRSSRNWNVDMNLRGHVLTSRS
jgi:hypothetical protein